MNRKQFYFVLVALAFIGGAMLVLLHHQEQSWKNTAAKSGGSMMPGFELNEVTSIHVRGRSDFNVVRENGVWRVAERHKYPANLRQVRQLLLNMRDLKAVQSELVGPSQLERVELNPPGRNPGAGTLLEFKDAHGQTLGSLLVGKRHERPQNDSAPPNLHGLFDGRYVLLPRAPGNVLLIPDELAGVAPDPEGWLSREFFKVENAKSISVNTANPASSWMVSRVSESDPWTLPDSKPGEVVDSAVAARPAELLEFPSFINVMPRTEAEGGSSEASVTTETFDGFHYELKIGSRTERGTYLLEVAVKADFQEPTQKLKDKLTQEQALAAWVFEVEPSRIEPLLRDRSQFLQKPVLVSERPSGKSAVPEAQPTETTRFTAAPRP